MFGPPSSGVSIGRGGLFFALLLAGSFSLTPAGAAKKEAPARPDLAVAPLKTRDVPEGDAQLIADSFRADLIGTKAFRVVDRTEMEQILTEQKFQLVGVTNEAEAVRLGRLLNVKEMVFGSLSRLDKSYYLTVSAISIETAEIKASKSLEANSIKKLRAKLPKVAKEFADAYK